LRLSASQATLVLICSGRPASQKTMRGRITFLFAYPLTFIYEVFAFVSSSWDCSACLICFSADAGVATNRSR
jgi:hypothetical protein